MLSISLERWNDVVPIVRSKPNKDDTMMQNFADQIRWRDRLAQKVVYLARDAYPVSKSPNFEVISSRRLETAQQHPPPAIHSLSAAKPISYRCPAPRSITQGPTKTLTTQSIPRICMTTLKRLYHTLLLRLSIRK